MMYVHKSNIYFVLQIRCQTNYENSENERQKKIIIQKKNYSEINVEIKIVADNFVKLHVDFASKV